MGKSCAQVSFYPSEPRPEPDGEFIEEPLEEEFVYDPVLARIVLDRETRARFTTSTIEARYDATCSRVPQFPSTEELPQLIEICL